MMIFRATERDEILATHNPVRHPVKAIRVGNGPDGQNLHLFNVERRWRVLSFGRVW